jgi:hypothetical protein
MPHPFDSSYTPAFPVLPIVVRNPVNATATPTLAGYLDTGADGTLVPSTYLRGLGVVNTYPMSMRSHWGRSRTVFLYTVDLEVAGSNLPGIEVIADTRGQQVLLGRNVLNRLVLLLDGVRNATDVLTRRPTRL